MYDKAVNFVIIDIDARGQGRILRVHAQGQTFYDRERKTVRVQCVEWLSLAANLIPAWLSSRM